MQRVTFPQFIHICLGITNIAVQKNPFLNFLCKMYQVFVKSTRYRGKKPNIHVASLICSLQSKIHQKTMIFHIYENFNFVGVNYTLLFLISTCFDTIYASHFNLLL